MIRNKQLRFYKSFERSGSPATMVGSTAMAMTMETATELVVLEAAMAVVLAVPSIGMRVVLATTKTTTIKWSSTCWRFLASSR